jgi:hypothetical protein
VSLAQRKKKLTGFKNRNWRRKGKCRKPLRRNMEGKGWHMNGP